MANNSTVKAQRQSLRNIHYAILTSDTPEGIVAMRSLTVTTTVAITHQLLPAQARSPQMECSAHHAERKHRRCHAQRHNA